MTQTIINNILDRVNKVNYAEKHGYVTKHHDLYPDAWKEPFHYPITVGGTLVPALNIIPKDEFNKEMEDDFNQKNVYQIGTLDFWDEFVEFFGSFQHNHALYTKVEMEELKMFGLPECFLHTVEVFKYPDQFKWSYHSVNHGASQTTVICVLEDDGTVTLYRRH